MMKDKNKLEEYIVQINDSVIEAMAVINDTAKGIVLVCDLKKLYGILTDGDIRRFILSGGDLQSPVSLVANTNFKYLELSDDTGNPADYSSQKVKALPVIDSRGDVVKIYFDDDKVIADKTPLNLPVVIMAGGKGTRLYPYTQILPKPLIPVNEIPITMHIMKKYADYGCNDFYMIVNHQKHLIMAYYSQDEIPFNVQYIEESKPLGTGGGLKYLQGKVNEPFFLNNCDVLMDLDYADLYRHHVENNSLITMVCATKKITIPYGTVSIKETGAIDGFIEKPSYSFLANTGLYLIDPRFLEYIHENEVIHITEIIERCLEQEESISVYPISDNQWYDMGQLSELEKMQLAFGSDND